MDTLENLVDLVVAVDIKVNQVVMRLLVLAVILVESGTSGSGPAYGAGGGGGAGGAGVDGTNAKAGNGGLGRQVPAIFRDPNSRVGHPGPTGTVPGTTLVETKVVTSGLLVAVVVQVTMEHQPLVVVEVLHIYPGNPYAGAGYGSYAPNPGTAGEDAVANSGSGGGGAGSNNTPIACKAGSGGSVYRSYRIR